MTVGLSKNGCLHSENQFDYRTQDDWSRLQAQAPFLKRTKEVLFTGWFYVSGRSRGVGGGGGGGGGGGFPPPPPPPYF